MAITVNFEKLQQIIEYIVNAENPTKDDIVNTLIQASFTQEDAENWINAFMKVLCDFLGVEYDINKGFEYVKNQANIGKTSEQITDILIGMFGSIASFNEIVIILKDGKLYKEFAPLNVVKKHFNSLFVDTVDNIRMVKFTYRDKQYSINFENMPEKFKQLYVLRLKLNNHKIPEDLEQYNVSSYVINDLYITIDLTNAQVEEI